LDPERRREKLLDHNDEWDDDVADRQDGEVGRGVVGRVAGKFDPAVRAFRSELQVAGEYPSLTAAWTAPAEAGGEGGKPICVRMSVGGEESLSCQ
jgi:hypothetical protein